MMAESCNAQQRHGTCIVDKTSETATNAKLAIYLRLKVLVKSLWVHMWVWLIPHCPQTAFPSHFCVCKISVWNRHRKRNYLTNSISLLLDTLVLRLCLHFLEHAVNQRKMREELQVSTYWLCTASIALEPTKKYFQSDKNKRGPVAVINDLGGQSKQLNAFGQSTLLAISVRTLRRSKFIRSREIGSTFFEKSFLNEAKALNSLTALHSRATGIIEFGNRSKTPN